MYYCSTVGHTGEISRHPWIFLLCHLSFHLSVDPLEWDPCDLGFCSFIIQIWGVVDLSTIGEEIMLYMLDSIGGVVPPLLAAWDKHHSKFL